MGVLEDRGVEHTRPRLDDLHPEDPRSNVVVDALCLEPTRTGTLLGDRAEVDDMSGHAGTVQSLGEIDLQQWFLANSSRLSSSEAQMSVVLEVKSQPWMSFTFASRAATIGRDGVSSRGPIWSTRASLRRTPDVIVTSPQSAAVAQW